MGMLKTKRLPKNAECKEASAVTQLQQIAYNTKKENTKDNAFLSMLFFFALALILLIGSSEATDGLLNAFAMFFGALSMLLGGLKFLEIF